MLHEAESRTRETLGGKYIGKTKERMSYDGSKAPFDEAHREVLKRNRVRKKG